MLLRFKQFRSNIESMVYNFRYLRNYHKCPNIHSLQLDIAEMATLLHVPFGLWVHNLNKLFSFLFSALGNCCLKHILLTCVYVSFYFFFILSIFNFLQISLNKHLIKVVSSSPNISFYHSGLK